MSLDLTVSELRNEISQFRKILFVAATAILVILVLWNLWTVVQLPRYEKAFEDLLGSRDKLPHLTNLVLNYARAANGLLPHALVVSGATIAWSLMMRKRHNAGFMVIAVFAIFALLAHLFIIHVAVNLPMQQLIMGISARP